MVKRVKEEQHISIPFSKEVFYRMCNQYLSNNKLYLYTTYEPDKRQLVRTEHLVDKYNYTLIYDDYFFEIKMTYDNDMNTLTISTPRKIVYEYKDEEEDEERLELVVDLTPESLLVEIFYYFRIDYDDRLCLVVNNYIIDKKTGNIDKVSGPPEDDDGNSVFDHVFEAYEKMFGYGEALNELFNEE